MTHNRQDIANYHIGQAATIPLRVEDKSGDPVTMTAGDATFTLMPRGQRQHPTDEAEQYVQKTVGDGIEIVDGPNGELEISLSPADTEGLPPRPAWYRVDVTDADGDPVPGAVAGEFDLVRD